MVAKNAWSLRNMYLYLVCLITLVMVIFSAVGLVRSLVSLAYPDPGWYMAVPKSPEGVPQVDPAEAARQQENQRQQAERQAVISAVGNGAMLLLAGPLYAYHWRKIEHGGSASQAM